MYLLKQAVILDKWSHADLDSAISTVNALPDQQAE
jgi:hypothetical protein